MPTKMSRGRPRTNTNNVNIDEILVEFLSEKKQIMLMFAILRY